MKDEKIRAGDIMDLEKKILEQVDGLKDSMIEGILELVRIDSVEAEAEPDAPLGRGVRTALDKALEIGRRLGFRTVNIDNYIGYVEYGQGDDYVCAIGHVDVVPTGDGWKQPPFSGYIEDGTIYSRGVLDNKGPIMTCLYGLYALKELGYEPKHQIRIIFGCDEESGFEDLKYYLKREKAPVYGFTPDCKFPVVYAERGRAVVRISAWDGAGQASAGHGEPSACADYQTCMNQFFAFVTQYFISAKNNGDRLGIDFKHPEYGIMEMRGYKLAMDGEVPYFEASLSYPAGHGIDEILERVREKAGELPVMLIHNYDPVVFEKDSPMVRAMQHSYEAVTGQDGTPVTTTGGTYAKAMPGIVPFGPSFPGQKGIGHNPNEWMKIDDLMANAKIYALALYQLGLL